jgi:Uma2 family endonuclease
MGEAGRRILLDMATLAPPISKMTLAEFEAFIESQPEGRPYYELHDGEVIELPPPKPRHQLIASGLMTYLGVYLLTHPLGRVAGEWRIKPLPDYPHDYIADVIYCSFQRFPTLNLDDYLEGVPDLVVEIYSPGNTEDELQQKTTHYLKGGAKQVWLIYPKTQQLWVYRADHTFTVIEPIGVLDGGDVLPGFTLNMSEFWAKIK